jgi:hypothetical protein
MASQLNGYHNSINVQNKEGQTKVSIVIDKFISPLAGDEHNSLLDKDFQKLKDNLLWLITSSSIAQQFGLLFQRSLQMILPFLQIIGVPEQIIFSANINMFEQYLDENTVLARKHASMTWGNQSFTIMATNTINTLTIANGLLTCTGALTEAEKDLVLWKIHSKIWGRQLME